ISEDRHQAAEVERGLGPSGAVPQLGSMGQGGTLVLERGSPAAEVVLRHREVVERVGQAISISHLLAKIVRSGVRTGGLGELAAHEAHVSERQKGLTGA